MKRPRGIDELVFQVWDFANKWSRKYTKVWSSKEHGFQAYVKNLDKETVESETKFRLNEAAYLLHCMAKEAENLASKAATIQKIL